MSTTLSEPITAQLFDGRTPVGRQATVTLAGATLSVEEPTGARVYPTHVVSVSPRTGSTVRFLALPDGTQLHCADGRWLDRLPQEGRTEGIVAWFEQHWTVALAAVAITNALLILGYFYGLPAAAERIAKRIPIAQERRLGIKTLGWLDEHHFLSPTKLSTGERAQAVDGFVELTRDLPLAASYRLEFRDGTVTGANAFTLPGAIVVVTDQMVRLVQSREEALAFMAHEIGHVEGRHTLRHVIQTSAGTALAAGVTSDVSSLTLASSGLPVALLSMNYSRKFETQADSFAFALLERHGVSPLHFASLVQRLQDSKPDSVGAIPFLSSHPVPADRIARARAAAQH
ncbi:MAG: M48 family metallopeptidase [Gemmatimonadaceae bacterium]